MKNILKNSILEVLQEIKIINILKQSNFIKQANDLGMSIIARLPNNKLIWNFKGKHKTLNSIYDSLKNIRNKQCGQHGKYLTNALIKLWNILFLEK